MGRTTFADFEDTVEGDDLDIVPLKMGSRSIRVKQLPSVSEGISDIIKVTKSIGKKRKLTKKKDATIRIISPWLGEYDLYRRFCPFRGFCVEGSYKSMCVR